MTTRVLIINRQLVFAVTIKQALEQTGAFEVHPFTAADTALDYLRTHPHEVALVDFTLPGMPGPEIVRRLRALQPEIAIIVSPAQPDASALIRDLKLQGIIDAPFSARSIIPLIEHAVEQIEQPLSAVTRNLPGSEDDATFGETEVLGGTPMPYVEEDLPPKRQKPVEPTGTRILDTRHFEPPSKPAPPGVTRVFDEPPSPEPMPPGATRIFDENQLPPTAPETRVLDDAPASEPKKKIKPLTGQLKQPPAAPPSLPEFSSLDNVLSEESPSEIFEPPMGDGDTPPVPEVDSDAVRQFLATTPQAGNDGFGDLLGTIDPAEEPVKRDPSSSFDHLVNSMRAEQQHRPLPDRQQQFIDFILTGGMDTLLTEIEKSKTGPLTPKDQPEVSTFDKLAQEEPPMPSLEESGTVGDLMLGVSDTSFRNVLAMMRGDESAIVDESQEMQQHLSKDMEDAFAAFFEQQVPPFVGEPAAESEPDEDQLSEDSSGAIPAQLILETAQDESTPVESFSLNTLISSIERQLSEYTPDIQPLPSWGENITLRRKAADERYIKEPDFLPEEGFTSQMIPVVPERAAAEPPAAEQSIEPEPGHEDILSAIEQEAAPPVSLPEWDDLPVEWDSAEQVSAAPFLDDWNDVTVLGEPVVPEWLDETPAASEPERPAVEHDFFMQVDESPNEPTVLLEQPSEPAPELAPPPAFEPEPLAVVNEPEQVDDPYIAQIALSLTQVSLELTADATLLTRDQELVAFAGTLTREDIEEFSQAIGGDWSGEGDEARIRFIRLASSGKDYMLYSRKTAGDFTLSMIFAASTPLRDIRRQGKRLIEALESVPEVPVPPPPPVLPEMEDEPTPPPAPAAVPETFTPYAYVWLPDMTLPGVVSKVIAAGLHVQLQEKGWRIHRLDAQGEYIYILADVPGEQPVHEVVRDLKRRAAEVVRAQNPDLAPTWTDGYLVMTPGRDLDAEEIEQFIRFERLL